MKMKQWVVTQKQKKQTNLVAGCRLHPIFVFQVGKILPVLIYADTDSFKLHYLNLMLVALSYSLLIMAMSIALAYLNSWLQVCLGDL